MTIWETIQTKLEEHGIKTFPHGLATGECKENYVVLKESGSTQISNYSSERVYFDFILYVPKNKYNILSVFEDQVKAVLDEQLYPLLMPTGQNTPDFYDDDKKAHMRSFMYRINRRNKHL